MPFHKSVIDRLGMVAIVHVVVVVAAPLLVQRVEIVKRFKDSSSVEPPERVYAQVLNVGIEIYLPS